MCNVIHELPEPPNIPPEERKIIMAIQDQDDEYLQLEPEDEPEYNPPEDDYTDIFLEQFHHALSMMAAVYKMHREKKGDSWNECSVQYLRDKLREEMTEWWHEEKSTVAERDELTDMLNVGLMLLTRMDETKLKPSKRKRHHTRIDHSLRR